MASKITPKELQEGKDEYMILDVREADELEDGKIDGAINIPLGQLIRRSRHGELDDLVRFFTENEIQDLMRGFEFIWIREEY